jgi:hypothetical protein
MLGELVDNFAGKIITGVRLRACGLIFICRAATSSVSVVVIVFWPAVLQDGHCLHSSHP